MADDAFYSANHVPAVRTAKPGEVLWELCREHVPWSAELRFQGESWGWEAQILVDGDRRLGLRFLLREEAARFAEAIRAEIESDRWPTTDDFRGETRQGRHE